MRRRMNDFAMFLLFEGDEVTKEENALNQRRRKWKSNFLSFAFFLEMLSARFALLQRFMAHGWRSEKMNKKKSECTRSSKGREEFYLQ